MLDETLEQFTGNVELSALAQNLRRLRSMRGETIEHAAKMLGTRPAKLLKWETDQELPSVETIKLLAFYYNVSVEEITKRK